MNNLNKLSLSSFLLIFFGLLASCFNSAGNEYLEEGKQKFSEESYDESITLFDQAIQANSKLEEAYFYRGRARLEIQDCGNALTDFDTALEINPEESVYHAYRGAVSLCNNAYADAVQSLEKAIDSIDSNYILYFYRGLGYSRQGVGNALKDFSQALELSGDDPMLYIARAIHAYTEEDMARGLKDADKAIELDSSQADFYATRAALNQFDPNNFEPNDFEPPSSDKFLWLKLTDDEAGSIYDGVHSFQQALADWERAIELEEDPELKALYTKHADFIRELLTSYNSTGENTIFNPEIEQILSAQKNDFDQDFVKQPLENMYSLSLLELDTFNQQ